MLALEARFRALCLLLSSMLRGSYNANGQNGWGTLWFSKALEASAMIGYAFEMWNVKILSYPTMMEELEQMSKSTYEERAELALELMRCIQAMEGSRDILAVNYESLTIRQKASLLLRLKTDKEYRKLFPWEQVFYERLSEDVELKNI